MQNQVEEYTSTFKGLREDVERNFESYKRNQQPNNLPPIASLWRGCTRDYTEAVDSNSFFKPIVLGCRGLMNCEGINEEGLACDLEKFHQDIKNIQQLDHSADNLPRVHAWFDFHISRLGKFKSGLRDFEKLYKWLRYCYDTSDKDTAHFFVFFELSRDEEMRQVVFDKDGHVREFFRDSRLPGHVYLDKLASWFLARYDLDAGRAVLIVLSESAPKAIFDIGGDWRKRLLGKAGLFSLLTTFFLVFVAAGWSIEVKEDWAKTAATFISWPRTINSPTIHTWILLPYLLATISFVLFIIGFICLRWRGRYDQLRRLLPRLLGGILIGYIPLMSSEDVWKWLLTLPRVPAVCIWLLAITFSYAYLYVEARNTLSDCALSTRVKRDIAIRSGQVFLIGLAEAYVIGIVLCEFLGFTALGGLLPNLPSAEHYHVIKGWVGTLVPRVILLYAPLALFLGILVQLIWEEKTVTQPL